MAFKAQDLPFKAGDGLNKSTCENRWHMDMHIHDRLQQHGAKFRQSFPNSVLASGSEGEVRTVD